MKERRPEDGEARAERPDDRGEDNQADDSERQAREEVGREVSYKVVCPRRVIRCKSKFSIALESTGLTERTRNGKTLKKVDR